MRVPTLPDQTHGILSSAARHFGSEGAAPPVGPESQYHVQVVEAGVVVTKALL